MIPKIFSRSLIKKIPLLTEKFQQVSQYCTLRIQGIFFKEKFDLKEFMFSSGYGTFSEIISDFWWKSSMGVSRLHSICPRDPFEEVFFPKKTKTKYVFRKLSEKFGDFTPPWSFFQYCGPLMNLPVLLFEKECTL